MSDACGAAAPGEGIPPGDDAAVLHPVRHPTSNVPPRANASIFVFITTLVRMQLIGGYASMEFYFLFKLTDDASFLDDMPFSLFQKTSFHRVDTYIYFTIQGIDCKTVSMLI